MKPIALVSLRQEAQRTPAVMRQLRTCTWATLVLLLVGALVLSTGTLDTRGIPVPGSAYTSIDDGWLWLHSSEMPYQGSIVVISGPDDEEVLDPYATGFDAPGCYVRFLRKGDWSGHWSFGLSPFYIVVLGGGLTVVVELVFRRTRSQTPTLDPSQMK